MSLQKTGELAQVFRRSHDGGGRGWSDVASDARGCKEGSALRGECSLKRVCDLLEIRLWISGVQNPELLLVTH